jgi:hypothetical protein
MALAYSEYFESKKKIFWHWMVFLTAVSSVPAYYQMFTDFSPWRAHAGNLPRNLAQA